MLIDEINKSREIAEKARTSELSGGILEELDYIADNLNANKQSIQKFLDDTLVAKKIADETIFERNTILNTCVKIEENIDQRQEELARKLLDTVNEEKIQGNSRLERIWSQYRSDNFVPNQTMVVQLRDFIDDNTLDKLSKLANEIKANSIGTEKTIKDIDDYMLLTQAAVKKLDMSDEVKDFVLQLADNNSEVTLDSVTENILIWLKKNGMLKKIKLQM